MLGITEWSVWRGRSMHANGTRMQADYALDEVRHPVFESFTC